MTTDEEIWDFFRHVLRRLTDLEIEVAAMKIALRENYLPDYSQKVETVASELKAHPEYRDMHQWIDQLGFEELLAALSKYKGPVQ